MATLVKCAGNVMSITHSTFKTKPPEYTIVGARERFQIEKDISGLSILLLNRKGKPYREELLNNISMLKPREIIYIEKRSSSLAYESLCKKYENLLFILTEEESNRGEMINIAIEEASGEFVMLLWDDLDIKGALISSLLFEKIAVREELATTPLLSDSSSYTLPVQSIPVKRGQDNFEIIQSEIVHDISRTLFPYDYTALYHRKQFLEVGGFDGNLNSSFWQLADFGVRAALMGCNIVINSALKLSYGSELPMYDLTKNRDYALFALKNLSLKRSNGYSYLPFYSLFKFSQKRKKGIWESRSEYSAIKEWVKENSYKFKLTLNEIIDGWDI